MASMGPVQRYESLYMGTSSWAGGLNLDQVDQTALTDREPQGVILVTEHNAEVNAGFTVLRGSNHTPPLREEDWQRIPLNGGVSQEPFLRECIERVVAAYWEVVSTMVSNGRDDRDMTPAECQAWIQTGLALAPFCGHRMDTSRLGRCLVIGWGVDVSHYLSTP